MGRTIQGVDQPVAMETCLGWVLSGPIKGIHDDSQISISLVGHVMTKGNENWKIVFGSCGISKPWASKIMRFMRHSRMSFHFTGKGTKPVFLERRSWTFTIRTVLSIWIEGQIKRLNSETQKIVQNAIRLKCDHITIIWLILFVVTNVAFAVVTRCFCLFVTW